MLLMFSCTGKKAGQTDEVPTDSVADSSEVAVTDTMELLITETPMPRAADAMFDDFIFNFVANKKLQKERTVFPLRTTEGDKTTNMNKEQWKMERLFMRQGYYTLLFSDEEQMSENANASFLNFYQKFVTDSVFQLESINETVQFVGPDPDDDFAMMEGVITPDTWEAFAPALPVKVLYNIVYGKPKAANKEMIFLMKGVANGLEVELRFKKVGNKWLLMKMTT